MFNLRIRHASSSLTTKHSQGDQFIKKSKRKTQATKNIKTSSGHIHNTGHKFKNKCVLSDLNFDSRA